MGRELRRIDVTKVNRQHQLRKSLPKERGAEVVASIKQNGVLHPPLFDAKLNVVLGDVQIWGSRAAGEDTVLAFVEDREVTELEALRLQLSEDVQSVPLRLTEKAKGFKRMMELAQCSAKDAAASTGASSASVSRLLKVSELEPEYLELVDVGLGESKAYELSLMTAEERLALLPAVKQGKLTRDDLIAMRKTASGGTKGIGKPGKTVKVVLDEGPIVTVRGAGLDMDGYIGAIETLLRRAKKAKARGLGLSDFVRAAKSKKVASTQD